jgi:DeoR family glycerol-3-phosphate regulon repressor
MLTEERRRRILDRLLAEGAVAISALTRDLKVSRETVRRDLAALAGEGRLRQTRGGAMTETREASDRKRESVNAPGKRAIGRAAAALVPDGASVIIDSGTTPRALAAALVERRNLVVYTTDLVVARTLARRNANRVVLLGGELQQHEDSTSGWDAVATLAQYRADFAFIGTGGLGLEGAITDFTRGGAELRARMMAAAATRALLLEHTKFGRATAVEILGIQPGTLLVVDRKPPSALARALEKRKIKTVVAVG